MSDWAPKRFWSTATFREIDGGGHEILLDDKVLQTPGRNPLVVPTAALAELISAEWGVQEEKIDPTAMPFTRMANSAVERIGARRPEVVDYIAGYAETDLLCYRAASPRELVERQRKSWDPLLDWASDTLNARLFATEGIMPIEQSPDAVRRLKQVIDSHGDFGLMGLHDMVSLSGSLVLGLAAARDVLPPGDIWERSRLDELWQIEQWGEDEEAADVASTKAQAFMDAHRFFHAAS